MITRLSNDTSLRSVFEKIGVDCGGQGIMAKKGEQFLFYISGLNIKAANILKQDALSIGADLAVSKDMASMSADFTKALLICNKSQLEKLIKKESIQPFGLKKIADGLKVYLSSSNLKSPQIMGILNINEDSFFEKSRTSESVFCDRFLQTVDDGADIIDIGAVSSRPGSVYCGEDEELRRLSPIFESIQKNSLFKSADISVDTFSPKAAKAALDAGCKIINDICGLESDELAEIAGKYSAKVVIMHKKGETATMQNSPSYDDIFGEVSEFFKDRIQKAVKYGIKDIVLDVGIGFGKSLSHNTALIKHLGDFKKFGFELLVGASRKSMIGSITGKNTADRLAGTLAVHQKALDYGADIIRCHDVKEHADMLKVWTAFKNQSI